MSLQRIEGAIVGAARLATCCLLLAAAGTAGASAEFAILRPTRDSTLIENASGALANGSGPAIFAGRVNSSSGSIRRALVRFDVSAALPPGSVVTGARLGLNLSGTSAGPVAVRLFRILDDWGEGPSSSTGGSGAPSAAGDSTWIHRFYDDVFWDTPGGDFGPGARGAAIVDQPGPYVWGSTPEMLADVQSWLDDPSQNFGWILLGDESLPQTVKKFDSRESPEALDRPSLEIDYVPPCAPDPVGPGYWRQQCEGVTEPSGAAGRASHLASRAGPGFAESILPCAERTLGDLGLPGIDACGAVLSDPPLSCEERAARTLSVLVLNVCAGRLQTSCPVAPDDGACLSSTVGDLLFEISNLIRAASCRSAASCTALSD